jgi:arylsulfatase A
MYRKVVSRRSFLQAGAGALVAASTMRSQSQQPPNIVLILADDLGYGDLHSYGSKISTPNLDSMAEEGVRFGQFYATNNVCSPSRASLLTGRYAPRVGVPNVLSPTDTTGLSLTDKTIAEVLKPVGYQTMCVGKWHLGTPLPYMPTSRGFDHYYGIPYSNDMSPSVLMQDTTVIESPVQLDNLTQRYTQQATRFISQAKGSPFFLYLAHTFPHIPLAASPAFLGTSKMGLYGDVVEELDWSVGQVLQSLKDNGVDSNTLVMFTSDNGPWYLGSPGRLRGRKGWTYEGGVREPFIARWPGKIPTGSGRGRISNAMATTMDLLPTIAGLCNAPLPSKPLDGLNIWPVLSGQAEDVANREVFLYFDSWNLQCARLGQWKLHVSRYNSPPFGPDPAVGSWNLPISPELYNLTRDPDESYNVAAEHPDIVAKIQARIQALLPTFPSQVMSAWNSTMSLKTMGTPDGALPVPQTPP